MEDKGRVAKGPYKEKNRQAFKEPPLFEGIGMRRVGEKGKTL